MRSFKQFIIESGINRQAYEALIESEISQFAMSEEEFFALSEAVDPERVANFGKHVQNIKDAHAAEHAVKSENQFKKLKAGAQSYFSKSPEEQKAVQVAANKHRPAKLFTDEKSNPKLEKSGKEIATHETKGLTLAPATKSGIDVCPAATKECKASCLGTNAGMGRMKMQSDARVDKTKFAFEHPEHFYAKLDQEIGSAKKAAAKRGNKLAVRLNVASDIPHEHIAPELFKKHSDVHFYDYTKMSGRAQHKNMPSNYHLTLSSTGLHHPDSNWKQVRKHLDKGGVASMVFHVKPGISGRRDAGELPTHVHDKETGKSYRVIDGDKHDHRHLDHEYSEAPKHEGLIAGLRIKGGSKNEERAGNFAVETHGKKVVVA